MVVRLIGPLRYYKRLDILNRDLRSQKLVSRSKSDVGRISKTQLQKVISQRNKIEGIKSYVRLIFLKEVIILISYLLSFFFYQDLLFLLSSQRYILTFVLLSISCLEGLGSLISLCQPSKGMFQHRPNIGIMELIWYLSKLL